MTDQKTLTFSLMDGPFEQARTVTALRMIDICAKRGWNVHVFAYEGAVMLPFAHQKKHANAVHGHTIVGNIRPIYNLIATLFKPCQTCFL